MNPNRTAAAPARAPSPRMEIFAVREPAEKGGKAWWTKIGAAFQNRDGSWSIALDALPLDGRLQMRSPKPRAEDDGR